MSDERVFATKHMNKPMSAEGLKIEVSSDLSKLHKVWAVPETQKTNFRKLLYIFLIPLLIIDWIVTLLSNIVEIITNSIKELSLALESFINHADSKPPEQET